MESSGVGRMEEGGGKSGGTAPQVALACAPQTFNTLTEASRELSSVHPPKKALCDFRAERAQAAAEPRKPGPGGKSPESHSREGLGGCVR